MIYNKFTRVKTGPRSVSSNFACEPQAACCALSACASSGLGGGRRQKNFRAHWQGRGGRGSVHLRLPKTRFETNHSEQNRLEATGEMSRQKHRCQKAICKRKLDESTLQVKNMSPLKLHDSNIHRMWVPIYYGMPTTFLNCSCVAEPPW